MERRDTPGLDGLQNIPTWRHATTQGREHVVNVAERLGIMRATCETNFADGLRKLSVDLRCTAAIRSVPF